LRFIDPHHHLWDLGKNRYPWLADVNHDRGWGDWSALRQNYLVEDFLQDARPHTLLKSVHVQANFDPRNPVGETAWLDSVAAAAGSRGFPQGIVAFVDLSRNDAEAVIEAHKVSPRLRGIRQVLNRHPDPRLNRAPVDFLANPTWQANFSLLRKHDLSFDAQIYYQQMPSLAALARRHPDTQFVLDHFGMPAERDAAGLEGWRAGMRGLAQAPNIAVKLSGFGMVDLHWTVDSIRPFVRETIALFGSNRCMFASNFPVDKLMRDYDRLWQAYAATVVDLSPEEQQQLFIGTAERIYRI